MKTTAQSRRNSAKLARFVEAFLVCFAILAWFTQKG
jgi:cell division protein FtsB